MPAGGRGLPLLSFVCWGLPLPVYFCIFCTVTTLSSRSPDFPGRQETGGKAVANARFAFCGKFPIDGANANMVYYALDSQSQVSTVGSAAHS